MKTVKIKSEELIVSNNISAFQKEQKEKLTVELVNAHRELEKTEKKLVFQNVEKEKRAAELIIANEELAFQNNEKEKKAEELIIANKELAFQNEEKEKRAAELIIANSELQKAEKVLISINGELNKINSELDRFVYSVSHELRSPLASIMGLHSIIDQNLMDEGNKEIYVLINKSIIKMDETIHDILDYSKNSRKEIKTEKIDFGTLIEDAFLHINYINPGFSFDKRIKVKLSEPFYSDKGRIKVILNNLISNSMKYGKKQYPDSFIDIKVVVNSRKIVLKISDNGIGIKQECLPRIFEMFYRATFASNGTGLGLYIAKECIEKLNGTIKVKSEFGKGTIFSIEIPNIANSKNELQTTSFKMN